MFQKCPVCNGVGKISDIYTTTAIAKPCRVCNGAGIISELTGLPPSIYIKDFDCANKPKKSEPTPYQSKDNLEFSYGRAIKEESDRINAIFKKEIDDIKSNVANDIVHTPHVRIYDDKHNVSIEHGVLTVTDNVDEIVIRKTNFVNTVCIRISARICLRTVVKKLYSFGYNKAPDNIKDKAFKDPVFLCTNGNTFFLCRYSHANYQAKSVEEFLALAAMNDCPIPIEGEYIKCIRGHYSEINSPVDKWTIHRYNPSIFNFSNGFFVKATEDEIIEHFKKLNHG